MTFGIFTLQTDHVKNPLASIINLLRSQAELSMSIKKGLESADVVKIKAARGTVKIRVIRNITVSEAEEISR